MKLVDMINMTPHPFTLYKEGEEVLTVEPSGSTVRIHEEAKNGDPVEVEGCNIPSVEVEYGKLKIDGDLTADELREAGAVLVSFPAAQVLDDRNGPVAQALKDGRTLVPGKKVRDESGRPIGVENVKVV